MEDRDMQRQRLLFALLFVVCAVSSRGAIKSLKVAIIGGAAVDPRCISGANVLINGGCLPVTGPAGELGDFQFSGLAANTLSAATLAPFDTAVLNVASNDLFCDP